MLFNLYGAILWQLFYYVKNMFKLIILMINNRLNDLTDLVESTGFKKDNSDSNLDYLEKYLFNKENKTKKK